MDSSVQVDLIWNRLKPFGVYQVMRIIYAAFNDFQVAIIVLNFVIIGHIPDFSCSRLLEPLSQYGIPLLKGNSSDFLLNYGKCEITIEKNTTNNTIQTKHTLPCQEGFFFDQSEGATIISEWNLVCDRSGVGELGQTLIMAGQIVGATVFTSLADSYGRKPVFVGTNLLLLIMSLALSFVPTFFAFAIVRFVVGALQQGMGLASYIMILEIVPQQYRGMIGALGQFIWTGYVVILSGIGYGMRRLSWRYIQLATSLTSFHAVVSYWIVDESLRWLIVNNRKKEAIRLIKKVARRNNVSEDNLADAIQILEEHEVTNEVSCNGIPNENNDSEVMELSPHSKDNKPPQDAGSIPKTPTISQKKSFFDILRHKHLLRNSLVLWFTWFIISLTYFGLYLTSTPLTGNRHLEFFLNGLMELPGGIIFAVLVNRIGRKKSSILLHSLTGVSLIASVVILEAAANNGPLVVLSTIFNYVGKIGVAGSYGLLYLYTPELYPTNVRNIGVGVCSCAARLGGMIAPYSNLFSSYVMWGPGVVFGICCVFVSVLFLTLPETCGKELPQTIDEYNDWANKPTYSGNGKGRLGKHVQ